MTGPIPDLSGRHIVVTGATGGIGRVAAGEIARTGAHLTLIGRNREKTERTAEAIGRSAGNRSVDFLLADLSTLAEVRDLAGRIAERHPRLDVLVNNAGGIFTRRQETAEGLEMTLALNHLAYFGLTHWLRPNLEAAGDGARVVNVASDAHFRGRLHLEDLQLTRGYGGWKAYSQSKLCNILFTRELARRLEGTGITANCVHPGFVDSGFGHNNGLVVGLGMWVAMRFARSMEDGAVGLVHLATSKEVEGVTGEYFMDTATRKSSRTARDMSLAATLWEHSEALVRSVLGEDALGPVNL